MRCVHTFRPVLHSTICIDVKMLSLDHASVNSTNSFQTSDSFEELLQAIHHPPLCVTGLQDNDLYHYRQGGELDTSYFNNLTMFI